MMLPLTGILYKLTPPMQHVGLKRHLSVYNNVWLHGYLATFKPQKY